MEKPTSYDLSEAIRRWRAEFGSPSPLSPVELEELEAHLRDHVAALEAGGMTPEAAFRAAVKQLGDRQRVATEFAKINPRRIWLERAIWMTAGFFLLAVLGHLAAVPSNAILGYGFTGQWDPAVAVVASRVCYLGGVAFMAVLLWLWFKRRPAWGRALTRYCEQKPLWAGIVMVLALWGTERLSYYWKYILECCVPRLDAWLFPTVGWTLPDGFVVNLISVLCGVAETMIWAVTLCVLAVRVVRARSWLTSPSTGRRQQTTADLIWLERLLWMVAGGVLVQFATRDLHDLVLLPALWVQSLLGPAAVPQHLFGFAMAVLVLVSWALPFVVCWVFAIRQPRLADWVERAFLRRPLWASLGVTLLLNANGVLGLALLLTDTHVAMPGGGFTRIASEWHWASWMVIWSVAPAVLLVTLLRWRIKLGEAR